MSSSWSIWAQARGWRRRVAGAVAADGPLLGQLPQPAHLGVAVGGRPRRQRWVPPGPGRRRTPGPGRRPARPRRGSGRSAGPARPRCAGGRRGRGQPAVDVVQAAPGPHRGQGGGQRTAGRMVVVDVVGGDDLGAGPVGQGDQGVVAGRVERVAVVPQLHHHVGPDRTGPCSRSQLAGGPGRAVRDQGRRDDPLAAAGEHHPVVGHRGSADWPSPTEIGDSPQVRARPRPRSAARVSRSTSGPSFFPASTDGPPTGPGTAGCSRRGRGPGSAGGCPPGSATPFCGRVSPRDSSAPNTVGIPTARAASAKRTTPYMPSWSVTARASRPRRAASSTSSSGWEAPSRKLKLEWQCSSA